MLPLLLVVLVFMLLPLLVVVLLMVVLVVAIAGGRACGFCLPHVFHGVWAADRVQWSLPAGMNLG